MQQARSEQRTPVPLLLFVYMVHIHIVMIPYLICTVDLTTLYQTECIYTCTCQVRFTVRGVMQWSIACFCFLHSSNYGERPKWLLQVLKPVWRVYLDPVTSRGRLWQLLRKTITHCLHKLHHQVREEGGRRGKEREGCEREREREREGGSRVAEPNL